MALNFCPLCKSIMKDGICSNRNCRNSIFEISFNQEIKNIKKWIPKKYFTQFDGAFNLDINLDNPLNYNQDSIRFMFDLSLAENVINYGIKTFKLMTYINETDKPLVEILRYFSMKEGVGKVKCLKKHYFSCTVIAPEGNNIRTPVIGGTNDFLKWDDVGRCKSMPGSLKDVRSMIGLAHYKIHNWTLEIKDPETGIGITNLFTKEKAYELFKDREIKQGNQRRTALKHIVGEFERQKPKKTIVDEYFRGDMEFEWRNLIFKLHPPIIDDMRINGI